MLNICIYGMIYLGSALMVCNICSYIRYAGHVQMTGDWARERLILNLPLILLVCFLFGYLAVGIFGKPDLIISAILFGGSIFVAMMVYLLRRITERIKENEKLESKLMAAETSSRAKTTFLSNMSHEMRTPMNAIIGLVRLSQEDGGLSLTTQAHLEQIDASARHMLSIINEVLDMNDIYEGRLALREARFSFREAMMQFNSAVGSQCHEKGLSYNCQSLGEIDEEFIGDEMKLKNVLLCVADNAVKFTDAPGSVNCTVEQLEHKGEMRTLRFVVRDTGCGIAPDFMDHMFDAFTREDLSSTNSHGGSGLGLSIAKTIVEMMGGQIDIVSEKGVGTTVNMTVKLRAVSQEAQAEPAADAETEVNLEGRRILIAEDIDLNAEILTDLLDMEGMRSERGENGRITLDMFEKSEPGYYDAIFMDLRMPVMDGLECARRIRALDRPDAKTIPIVALTANAFDEDVKASLDAGMNVHLPKPADIDILCRTLRRLLQ